MGHCVSYTEVRHSLTSVAADQISRTESGVYIPTGLTGVAEHGIVDAAIDNFDQNEDTLDGKHTTHAMAIGKATALTRLKTHLCELQEMTKFGLSGSLEEALPVARRYALLLYGQKKKVDGHPCTNLDELRYTLASTTDLSAANLPPTEDAFQQHVLRALYQTAVWRHSQLAKPLLWTPVGRGWRLREDGCIEPVMFQMAPAPKEVRDITHLYCKDGNCNDAPKCQCLSVGLTCTEFCSYPFPDCPNMTHFVTDDNVDE
ncbi:hypothetical protein DPX16_17536 [Anabarilius grahami]|uniref:Uncharacterized protein n=1 Tax=Anabarilius grahami TaxID=495550 RepID=A0A3N0XZC4_ANAGA|nr:hypothetical protein DPX16_17536 [Anabarilius grahami]